MNPFLVLLIWIFMGTSAQTDFHSLTFRDIDGKEISMGSFASKKILIVNIATGTKQVAQLNKLEQLYQANKDNLVIIAFPSNSFKHEPLSNSEIKNTCTATYGVHFIIAEKAEVTGSGIHRVFNWLALKNENAVMNAVTVKDYQKFLINKEGMITGVFDGSIDPLDASVSEAINAN